MPDPAPDAAGGQRDSRVLVFSQRQIHQPVWHTAQYEFEDLLLQFDDVDLLAPRGGVDRRSSRRRRQVLNAARSRLHMPRHSPPWDLPDMAPTRVTGHHDLFFAVFHYPSQLPYLNRLQGWRERSTRAACLLVEAWSQSVAENADYLSLLAEFDVVYVFNPRPADRLRELGVKDVRFLPLAVDVPAFTPLPQPPPRFLDCYSYGRTSPLVHEALLDLVRSDGLAYLYDSMEGGVLTNRAEHRALVANMMKRSKFFLAFRINESPARRRWTGGEEALSSRYFEGAAGGAVMLGSAPAVQEFGECFDWDDAVIRLSYDGAGVRDLLAELTEQPERLAGIRADSVRNSLLRHDWLHRWKVVLEDLGLPPTDEMRTRQDRLEALAATATPELFLGA